MFAETLKQARNKNKKTITGVAQKLGVRPKVVWKWENGQDIPNKREMDKLHVQFGIPYDEWNEERKNRGLDSNEKTSGFYTDFDRVKLLNKMNDFKINRSELASRVGCTNQSISNWLKGKNPTYRYANKLSEVFGVDVEYWRTVKEEKKPEEEKTLVDKYKEVVTDNLAQAAVRYEEVIDKDPELLVNTIVESAKKAQEDSDKTKDVVKQLKIMNSTLKSIQSMISGLIVQLDD